jgi:GPH family glycoside/pentoside/hexuronide:cation symporter
MWHNAPMSTAVPPAAPSSVAATAVERLPAATLWAYAGACVGPNLLYFLALVMYLYFATVKLGVSPGALGTIFLISKTWDAVSDPLAGFLSDRTHSRLGRRRSWLLASSIPLAAFSVMMWAPPAQLEGRLLEVWIGVAVLGFYTAFTAFEVPHMALGAELTLDRVERNRIFGVRQFSRVAVMLVAYTGGVYVVREWGRDATAWLAVAFSLLSVVGLVGGVFALPAERAGFQSRGAQSPLRAVADVWRNAHARLLLFVFFIESIGIGAIGVLIPFVIQYVARLEHPLALPGILLCFVGSSLLAIPLWVFLARRFEKRRLWLVAMALAAFAYGLFLGVGEGDWPLLVAAELLAGIASACGTTLGQALKADLIDVDEHHTGQRKEGSYFAAWTFVNKLAGGVMVFLAGQVLEVVGFDRELAVQAPQVDRAILWLVGGMPLVGFAVGFLLFTRFDLSEAEHARIRAELDARGSG